MLLNVVREVFVRGNNELLEFGLGDLPFLVLSQFVLGCDLAVERGSVEDLENHVHQDQHS